MICAVERLRENQEGQDVPQRTVEILTKHQTRLIHDYR
jgi:hypothetical protein